MDSVGSEKAAKNSSYALHMLHVHLLILMDMLAGFVERFSDLDLVSFIETHR
jgi:hypothetical protein